MRTADKVLEKGSLPYFIGILEELDIFGGLYRGHKDATWKLTPGLYRDIAITSNDIEAAYAQLEFAGVNKFFARGMAFLPRYQRDPDSDIVVAQHYGVPTRLLDWTKDPMVALYFALAEPNTNVDAAIYFIAPRGGIGSITHLDQEIGIYSPRPVDERVINQKSVFTVHRFREQDGEYLPIDERDDYLTTERRGAGTFLQKLIIPSAFKSKLFWDLRRIGFDGASIFPGLAGIGTAIAEERRAKPEFNHLFARGPADDLKSGRVWRNEPPTSKSEDDDVFYNTGKAPYRMTIDPTALSHPSSKQK